MKNIILFISIVTFFTFSSCEKKKQCEQVRTGCVCNDNTTSTATGSGACAGHGGVKEWTTKEVCN
ncbi:MAG: hypothetical protein ACK504_12595 [Bacteroidota bacterium]